MGLIEGLEIAGVDTRPLTREGMGLGHRGIRVPGIEGVLSDHALPGHPGDGHDEAIRFLQRIAAHQTGDLVELALALTFGVELNNQQQRSFKAMLAGEGFRRCLKGLLDVFLHIFTLGPPAAVRS